MSLANTSSSLQALLQLRTLLPRRQRPIHWNFCATTRKSSNSSTVTTGSKVTIHKSSPAARHNNSNYANKEDNATELIDTLLSRTHELMNNVASNNQHHVVAYSGGVDSSLVAALLQQIVSSTTATMQVQESSLQLSSLLQSSQSPSLRLQAVLGISPAVSQEQITQARSVAHFLQIELVELETEEGSDDTYIQNEGKACLACKTHLYTSLRQVADFAKNAANHNAKQISSLPFSTQSQSQSQLYNGTNADDMLDATRVGLIAAQNFRVVSPLDQINKAQVRLAARHLGLPNWNAAAAPCLRSRLALGVHATQEHLQMIERAERKVRSVLFLTNNRKDDVKEDTTNNNNNNNSHVNLRVRMLAGKQAMVEIDEAFVHEALERLDELKPYFVSTLGFSDVAVRTFRSGSVSKPAATADSISTSTRTGTAVSEQ